MGNLRHIQLLAMVLVLLAHAQARVQFPGPLQLDDHAENIQDAVTQE